MDDIVITGHKGFIGKNLFKQFTSVIGIDEKYDETYINNFLNIHQPDCYGKKLPIYKMDY